MATDHRTGSDETKAAPPGEAVEADSSHSRPASPSLTTLRRCLCVVLHPSHLRRTSLIALLVGIWLTAFNENAQLLHGPWNASLAIKITMNVFTPFVVANLGLVSRQGEPEADAAE